MGGCLVRRSCRLLIILKVIERRTSVMAYSLKPSSIESLMTITLHDWHGGAENLPDTSASEPKSERQVQLVMNTLLLHEISYILAFQSPS